MSTTYYPIIGLEIHIELNTKSKMFCGCKNDPFHAEKPNTHTCMVCLGLPGGLPVANKQAIEWTALFGTALDCQICEISEFARKHYQYPDLPKGYQISQYDKPLCVAGKLEIDGEQIEITRVHLEEDTAKMSHTTVDGAKVSLIDFNRSGVPLMELVTEPCIRSAAQAGAFARRIREIVTTLGISEANMEQGSMRLEANISLSTEKNPSELPAYKVEVKNINSFRYLEQAIEYELVRQQELLEKGEIPAQETRGWNEKRKETVAQRTKESAEDYRYFPDPDLHPVLLSSKVVAELKHQATDKLKLAPFIQRDQLLELGLNESQANAVLKRPDRDQAIVLLKTAIDQNLELKRVVQILQDHSSTEELTIESIKSELSKSTESIDPELLRKIVTDILDAQPSILQDIQAGKMQAIGAVIGKSLAELKKLGNTNLSSTELATQVRSIISEIAP